MVHTWTVGRWIVYTGIRLLLLLIHPFISSFFFLSNFQALKLYITFFSGTVRPRRLKLGTHVDNGCIYRVYSNQAAVAYLSLCFFFHFLFSPIIKHLKWLLHFSQELEGLWVNCKAYW